MTEGLMPSSMHHYNCRFRYWEPMCNQNRGWSIHLVGAEVQGPRHICHQAS